MAHPSRRRVSLRRSFHHLKQPPPDIIDLLLLPPLLPTPATTTTSSNLLLLLPPLLNRPTVAMLRVGSTKRKATKTIHSVIVKFSRPYASLQFLALVLLRVLVSSPVLLDRVMVVATAATGAAAAAAAAINAAAAVGVMLPLTLRHHTGLKELIAFLLAAPTLTVAKVMQVATGGEVGGTEADFEAVGAAPVVGWLCELERGRKGGGG